MHNITERDAQYGLENAWHSLTKVVDEIDINDNYLTQWDVQRKPLFVGDVQTPFDILTATDDDEIVGYPLKKSYTEISNAKFIEIVRDVFEDVGNMRIVSLGSVMNREKVFVSMELKNKSGFSVGGRNFKDFLNFGNSHDQMQKLWVNNTNVCTVCDNTFQMNLNNSSSRIVSVTHKGDVDIKIKDAEIIIEEYFIGREKFIKTFEHLCSKSLTQETAKLIYAGFIKRHESDPSEVKMTSRFETKLNRFTNLFNNGRGNRGETYGDLFSGVTEFYTHFSTRNGGEDKTKQFVSSEFGLSRYNKQQFWDTITTPELLEKTIERGEKILQAV